MLQVIWIKNPAVRREAWSKTHTRSPFLREGGSRVTAKAGHRTSAGAVTAARQCRTYTGFPHCAPRIRARAHLAGSL